MLKIIIIPYLYKINSLIFNNLEKILLNFFDNKNFNINYYYLFNFNYLFNFYDLILIIIIIFFFKLFLIFFLFLYNNFKTFIYFFLCLLVIFLAPPDFFIQIKLFILFALVIEYTIFLKNYIRFYIINVFY